MRGRIQLYDVSQHFLILRFYAKVLLLVYVGLLGEFCAYKLAITIPTPQFMFRLIENGAAFLFPYSTAKAHATPVVSDEYNFKMSSKAGVVQSGIVLSPGQATGLTLQINLILPKCAMLQS